MDTKQPSCGIWLFCQKPGSREGWQERQKDYKVTIDFPAPSTTKAVRASYELWTAQAELVWTKHHTLKESIGGCLGQRSDLDSSAWV